jgi:hypothetical protein
MVYVGRGLKFLTLVPVRFRLMTMICAVGGAVKVNDRSWFGTVHRRGNELPAGDTANFVPTGSVEKGKIARFSVPVTPVGVSPTTLEVPSGQAWFGHNVAGGGFEMIQLPG